jgi:hypothetical protein
LACPTSSFCVAAGDYVQNGPNFPQDRPFFDVLASDHWATEVPPLPTDAEGAEGHITSVACASTTSCVAVGDYDVAGSAAEGLIDTLANGTWTASRAPLPAGISTTGQGVFLTSVSCGSDGTCAAIGYVGPDVEEGSPFIETLSAGTWTVTAAPLPSDAGTLQLPTMLSGVSCGSARACAVIGSYDGSDDGGALIDWLSSGHWVPLDAPAPSLLDSIDAVSCIASGCTGVGSFSSLGTGEPTGGFADTLSGGTWTTVQVPSPADIDDTVGYTTMNFSSVSCASDATCAAIGDYENSAKVYVPFTESLVGGSWTARVVPLPANSTGPDYLAYPTIVSCAPELHCTVIGSYYGSPSLLSKTGSAIFAYISSTSGGAWSSLEAPVAPSGTGVTTSWLTSIACPSSVLCFALGGYGSIASGLTAIIDTGFNVPGIPVSQIGASLRS